MNSTVVINQAASGEGIIIAIVIYAIIWAINAFSKSNQEEKIASISKLSLEVDKGKAPERFKLEDVECFNFRLKGWINNSRQDKIKVIIHAYDNTNLEEGEKQGFPLVCTTNYFQDEKSRVFKIQATWDTTADTYLPNWYDFISVPVDSLVPPLKGKRNIMFRIVAGEPSLNSERAFFDDAEIKKILHFSDCFVEHTFKEPGYMDTATNRERVEELSIEIAVAFATADGDLQKKELDVIKKWIVDITSTLEEKKSKERKDALSTILKNSYKDSKAKKISVSSILNQMNEKLSKAQKYEIIELLLSIASSDNKFGKEEDSLLSKIVKKLEVDEIIFANMKNKTIINVDEMETSTSTSEATFGIKEEMTNEEKCKLLRKHYSKWNAQTNSNNAKTKNRAKEMVKLIATLREKYNC